MPTPLALPKGYQRLGDFPIDSTSVFATHADLQSYATTNGTAYVGQICAVSDTGLVYVIRQDKSLTQLGGGVSSDVVDALSKKADLGVDGKIPASQLPSYVDDVLEFANVAAMPLPGESGKIYVSLDSLKTYRWGGSVYAEISSSAVTSVSGKTGSVTLEIADTSGLQTALDGKALATVYSDTAPLTPIAGQRWVDSTTLRPYEYYNNAWVEITPSDA